MTIRTVCFLVLFSYLAMGQTRIIPHVTRSDGGFTTTLILVNSGNSRGDYLLTAYDAAGVEVENVRDSVEPGKTLTRTVEDVFGRDDVAYILVGGSEDIKATVAYRAQGDDKGPAHVNESPDQGVLWRLYAGHADVTWDGVAVVNTSSTDNFLTIRAFDNNDNEVGVVSPFAPMAPGAKDLFVLSTELPNAYYYEVAGSAALAITALRGDLAGSSFLWENPPVRLADTTPQTATYELTVDVIWSEETHPGAYTGVVFPHLSHIGVAIHNTDATFWQVGELATPGIKRMAESGQVDLFAKEVSGQVEGGNALAPVLDQKNFGAPGSYTSVQFEVSKSHSLVTLVTMIAPSPDWFVGTSGFDLMENGVWLEDAVIDMLPYDAGTRTNNVFSLAGPENDPPEAISLKTDAPLSTSVGTFRLRRIQ